MRTAFPQEKNKPCGGTLMLALLALCATALWGSAFPFVKIGYQLFSIETVPQRIVFAGVRFTGAGCITLLLALLLGRHVPRLRPARFREVLILGLVQTGLQYVCFYIGLAHTPGARGSILDASSAFIGVLFAHFFTGDDKMTRQKAAGCIVGLCGILAMNLGGGLDGAFSFEGDGLMIIAAAAFAAGGLLSRRITVKGAEPAAVSGMQLLLGGLALLGAGLFLGGRLAIPSLAAGGLLLYLMLLSSGAFTLWALLLQRYSAARVSIFASMIPVFGVLFSGIFLREDILKWQNLAALLLVTLGIAFVNRPAHSARHH